jgi:hypothetical protein
LSVDQLFIDGGKKFKIPFSRSLFYQSRKLFELCVLSTVDWRALLFKSVKPGNVATIYKMEKADQEFSKIMEVRYRELGWTVCDETWEDFLEDLLDQADQIVLDRL